MSRQIQAARGKGPARRTDTAFLFPERPGCSAYPQPSSLPGGRAAGEWQDRHTCERCCHGGAGEYATGVSDLTRSPWLRAALLAGAVGLAGYGLVSQWPQVHAALPLPAAIRVMFVGQLGKYVPGAVWAVAAQVELARDYAVPRRRSATASLVSMAVTLVVGQVAVGLTLPLVSAHAVRHYWWVLAVIPLAAACLYPPVIKFGLDRVLRVLGRAPLEGSVSRGGMVRALGWTTLGWPCYG